MLLAMPAEASTTTATGTAVHLGRNIQTLREARGRTQQQIARIAGIPRATWANLESGAANPTLAVLIKVAQALQVRLEELIEPPRRTGRLYRAAELPTGARRARSPCASCCPRPSPAWRSNGWSCRRARRWAASRTSWARAST